MGNLKEKGLFMEEISETDLPVMARNQRNNFSTSPVFTMVFKYFHCITYQYWKGFEAN